MGSAYSEYEYNLERTACSKAENEVYKLRQKLVAARREIKRLQKQIAELNQPTPKE